MAPIVHPNPRIQKWRLMAADHECDGGCTKKDEQHWYYPRARFKTKIQKSFRNLKCVDWPNKELVCYFWHHFIFNPEFDRHYLAPKMPTVKVMAAAVAAHKNGDCGCRRISQEEAA